MTSTQPDLAAERWRTPADDAVLTRTTAALEANGINILRAANGADAKRLVLELIPPGAQVHHGASQTLEVTGLTAEIEGSGRYGALHSRLLGMDRETEFDAIRQLMTTPDVMLGSVHAVTQAGSLVTASATGGQLAPYAFGAGQVILVVGTHKIVSDLDEAFRRIHDYALPLEDARAMEVYGGHSGVNKILIINREWLPSRITVIFVDEPLGF